MEDEGSTNSCMQENNKIERAVGSSSLEQKDKNTQCDFPIQLNIIKNIFREKLSSIENKYKRKLGLVFEGACNSCFVSPILGAKFECIICKDYFLCEDCERHGHSHPMYKYKINQFHKK